MNMMNHKAPKPDIQRNFLSNQRSESSNNNNSDNLSNESPVDYIKNNFFGNLQNLNENSPSPHNNMFS